MLQNKFNILYQYYKISCRCMIDRLFWILPQKRNEFHHHLYFTYIHMPSVVSSNPTWDSLLCELQIVLLSLGVFGSIQCTFVKSPSTQHVYSPFISEGVNRNILNTYILPTE